MWFSMVCALIDHDTRHHSGQNLLWTHSAGLVSPQHFDTVMTHTRCRCEYLSPRLHVKPLITVVTFIP